MQANPEKFQVIAVSKKSFDKSLIFQIGTANISCDEDFLLTAITWNFSGFACMQLKLNQFMSILLSCCKTFTTSSKFGE
jgi:hypothetical protein